MCTKLALVDYKLRLKACQHVHSTPIGVVVFRIGEPKRESQRAEVGGSVEFLLGERAASPTPTSYGSLGERCKLPQ